MVTSLTNLNSRLKPGTTVRLGGFESHIVPPAQSSFLGKEQIDLAPVFFIDPFKRKERRLNKRIGGRTNEEENVTRQMASTFDNLLAKNHFTRVTRVTRVISRPASCVVSLARTVRLGPKNYHVTQLYLVKETV